MDFNMLSTNLFENHVDKFNIARAKSEYWVPEYNKENCIRIISGPIKKMAQFKGKEYEKQCMIIIDRTTKSIKILSASKGMFRKIVECINKHGDPINYDIIVKRDPLVSPFAQIEVYRKWGNSELSEDDNFLINNADLPDEFKIKKDHLLVVGSQFRIINKTVMLTKYNGDTRNVFGDDFPPCEIRFVDKNTVVIGRKDWDFSVDVDRDQALKKFEGGFWTSVKAPEEQPTATFCKIHKTLGGKGFTCCERQLLTEGTIRVIF